MRCSEVRERLIEYIDGLLEGSHLRSIEEHLQNCPDCRKELEAMRELEAGLKQEVPAMWKSIEPSPAFINRLKYMELEPERTSIRSFFDPLMVIFQNHRPAMAAGLTVLIAVVLALTIPGIIHEDDSGPDMVAEAPSPTVLSEESHDADMRATVGPPGQDESQSKGMNAGETAAPVPTTTGLNGLTFGWETYESESLIPLPAPAPSLVPGETLVLQATTPPATECTEAATAVYDNCMGAENSTVRIALSHPEVQGALAGRAITCIEVLQDVDLEGYVCSGSTVSIAVDETITMPVTPLLYVCVEAGSVTFVKIFPPE